MMAEDRQGMVLEEKGQEAREGELPLEEVFGQIEELIRKLEEPDTPIEEAFASYKEGMRLLHTCGERIDLLDQQVQVLGAEGSLDEF